MKKWFRFIALLAALCLLLAACSGVGTPGDPTGDNGDTGGETGNKPVETVGPTEPTEPVKQEAENMFAKLFPTKENIPDRRTIQSVCKDLSNGITGHVTEINYTWQKGRASMEVLGGLRDDWERLTPPESDPLQLIYDESEFYNYLLYLPDGYDPEDTETRWPVIFFFHGIGESGSNLEDVAKSGMPDYLRKGGKVPAIMIAPQCPGNSHWADTNVEEKKLVQFVPEIMEKYNIDADRMYLTGLSMGGRCTWKLALAMPDTFAAIAVCCGRTNTYEFDTIADMPIWMFHGCGDTTTSFDNVNLIIPELIKNDHRYFKLTAFPQNGHTIWDIVYFRGELYEWLLTQSLSANHEASK